MFRYSSISTAYECLKKYDLIFNKGMKIDEKSGNLEFGTALHLAINAFFDKEDAVETFKFYWNSVKDKELHYSYPYSWDSLNQSGIALLTRWLKLHAKKFTPKFVEQKVEFKVGEYLFNGTPDFVGEFDGVLSIVDWKTSSKPYDKMKIQTNEQMYLYAYAIKQKYNLDIKQIVYYVFVKDPIRIQTVTLELTDEKLFDMVRNVETMARDLSKRTEFPRNPVSCKYCPFFDMCYGKSKGENK